MMDTPRRWLALAVAFVFAFSACTSENAPAASRSTSSGASQQPTDPEQTATVDSDPTDSDPAGSDPTGSDPAASAPVGSDPVESDGPPDTQESPPAIADVELIHDGLVTDEALAALVVDGVVDEVATAAMIAALDELPEAERATFLADLSRRFELEAARISGLRDAIGDDAQTAETIDGAWSAVADQVAAIDTDLHLEPAAKPSGFAPAEWTASPPSVTGVALIGIVLAVTGLSALADPVISASNDMTSADQYAEQHSNGALITGAIEQSSVELDYEGMENGVAVSFHAEAVSHPCPDATGAFDSTAKIDISTSKGKAGHKATVDLTIRGQVDDNAKLAGSQTETRTQAADFGGAAAGQFLDLTYRSGSDGTSGASVNRTGGTVTDGFVSMSVLMNIFFAQSVGDKLLTAAEKAWSSGRCVRLDVTPSAGPTGLQPSAEVSVAAAPRSKIDGSPTGGSVTATLTSGGASVAPDGTKVPADATFNYVAPNEKDQTGAVAFEARSKRGVGRAGVAFDTKTVNAYVIVGGLQDWQVNQTVCNILEPFTLSTGVGTMQLSGGLQGTYEFAGMYGASYTGEYIVTLPDGAGHPGTMIGGGSGTIAGQAGSGTENYTLTPTTC